MIIWDKIIERHMQGTCNRGKVWVRFDREGLATGLYFIFDKTTKFMPADDELDVETIKIRAEILLEEIEYNISIEQKNKTLFI